MAEAKFTVGREKEGTERSKTIQIKYRRQNKSSKGQKVRSPACRPKPTSEEGEARKVWTPRCPKRLNIAAYWCQSLSRSGRQPCRPYRPPEKTKEQSQQNGGANSLQRTIHPGQGSKQQRLKIEHLKGGNKSGPGKTLKKKDIAAPECQYSIF